MSEAIDLSAPADALEAAHQDAYSTPLDKLDVARGELFENDLIWPYFERLRAEAPVHYCAEPEIATAPRGLDLYLIKLGRVCPGLGK